jgi:hypothetical protein
MSRSINGNLLGKAASSEMSDLRERIQHDAEQREKAKHLTHDQFIDVCLELMDIMGLKEYYAWVDATPEKGFSDRAAEKLVALKSLAFEVEQEIASDTEWLGELHNTRDVATVIANQLDSVRYVNLSDEGCGNDDLWNYARGR